MYFDIMKVCANMRLFTFKVGLNTFKLSKTATTEVMLDGQMQTSFINSKLQNVSIDNNYDIYFWSYNCDYRKYSMIYDVVKKEIQTNPKYWQFQTLYIKDWYLEVQNISIIQPELIVDDYRLDLNYYDYHNRPILNLTKIDKNDYNYQTKQYDQHFLFSDFIQIDEENQYLSQSLIDNVKESQEVR